MRPWNRYTAAALSILAFSAVAEAQTDRRSLSGDRVAVYNLAGKLRVEPGTGGDVVVEVTLAGRDAAKLRVESGEIRGRQTLRVIYPSDRVVYPEMERRSRTELSVREDGTFNDSGDHWGDRDRVRISSSGDGLEAHADLRVLVPRGRAVALRLGVGTATIANIDGDLDIDVASAEVSTEHTRGALNIDAGSGTVSVTGAEGDVSLDTGSGGLTLSGVKGGRLTLDAGSGGVRVSDVDVGDLKVDAGSGGVRLAGIRSPRVSIDAGSGSTELELLAAVEKLDVDGGSGGITVRLPAETSASVEIETGSGGIDSDFPLTLNRYERNHVEGRIGDGRARIHIESGSGRVRLLKR